MRWFSFICPILVFADMTWSSPQTVFSSPSESGVTPQITIDPASSRARAVWIGLSGQLFEATFSNGSWSTVGNIVPPPGGPGGPPPGGGGPRSSPITPRTLPDTLPQTGLHMAIDTNGVRVCVWNNLLGSVRSLRASTNNGSGWSAPRRLADLHGPDSQTKIRIAAVGQKIVISWLDANQQLQRIDFQRGAFSAPYLASHEDKPLRATLADGNFSLFSTTDKLVLGTATASSQTEEKTAFPRPVEDSSLGLSVTRDGGRRLFVTQDIDSKFLLGGYDTGNGFVYTTITPLQAAIVTAKTALSPIDDGGAAIWQLADGSIHAAVFEGRQWLRHVTLSTSGASPCIMINPLTNHPIAVWADNTGDVARVKVTEFNFIGWTTPTALSAVGSTIEDPKISMNRLGQAFVIWSRTPTGQPRVLIEAVTGTP